MTYTYTAFNVLKSWTDAQTACQSQTDGNLASVVNSAAQTAIVEAMTDASITNYLAWTSGYYNVTNSTWSWTDGNTEEVGPWGDSMPKNPSVEKCALVFG